MTKYPICKNVECDANNPEYGSHCDCFTAVTHCVNAKVEYRKNYLLRFISWLRKYGLNIVLLLAILAIIIFLAYVNWIFITGEIL